AARPAVESLTQVYGDLAREAREGLHLEDVQVVRALVERDDEPDVELAVDVDEPCAGESRRFVDDAEVRPVTVLAPLFVEELPHLQRVVAEAELGHLLGHAAS